MKAKSKQISLKLKKKMDIVISTLEGKIDSEKEELNKKYAK